MNQDELAAFLNEELALDKIRDVSNNGVQCEGDCEIAGVAFAVDACRETVEKAAASDCNFLFCHHGLSWGSGFARLTGVAARRFGLLLSHGMTLYAAHLPLDMHPRYGNNAQLCDLLKIPAADREPFGNCHGAMIGFCGRLPQPLPWHELCRLVEAKLHTPCRGWNFGNAEKIERVAVVSGGGGDMAEQAAAAGCQCLLTGEFLHQHWHEAAECGVGVIAAGHYATETVGPRAVMRAVQQKFPAVRCCFIEAPTGL